MNNKSIREIIDRHAPSAASGRGTMSITPLQPIPAWTEQAGYKLHCRAPWAGDKKEIRRMGDTSDQRLASSAAMTTVAGALAQDGFARVSAEEMRALLGPEGLAGWKGFADSWDDLGLDLFMADGGRYRRRR